MAWYRQYRPKQVQELNISSVREALQQLMRHGKMPQSLLFAGPKGTGKTSASRILGAMLNDPHNAAIVDHVFFGKPAPATPVFVEPDPNSDFARRVYEGHSFVVQELDAASNRRIDDIRLLKERIDLAPTEGKVTVYILDEVHMLTTEAFNALLKILEEPPAHVVFILATTELHKIPATIVSRCSVVHFRKATAAELQAALVRVLEAEKIAWKEADLTPIVQRADGSFRDGVKILELACQTGKLDLESVRTLLATDSLTHVRAIFDLVLAKDAAALSQVFMMLRDANYNQKDFYKDCLSFLHQDLLVNLGVVAGEAVYQAKIDQFLLKELLAANLNQESPIAFLVLELKLLELIDRSKGKKSDEPKEPPSSSEPVSSKKKMILESVSPTTQVSSVVAPVVESVTASVAAAKTTISIPNHQLKEIWQQFLAALSTDHFSLKTLLKSCTLESLQTGIAQVAVYYSFHKEQLEQAKNRSILQTVATEIFGSPLDFTFVLQEGTAFALEETPEADFITQAKDSLLS